MSREGDFQRALIKELKVMFPGCYILKNDSGYIQGIPDLLILYNDRWACLECKRHKRATKQANQDYHISAMHKLSFARFIYPENKKEVLDELQRTFRAGRNSCVSKP